MGIITKYRKAAQKLFGLSPIEAREAIVSAKADPNHWAPDARVIIYLDTGTLDALDLCDPNGYNNAKALSSAAGDGKIEHISGSVAAVY